MSTAIQWTDDVWNPVVGCTRVSEGCENCYAETFANRLEAMGKVGYEGLTRKHADGSVNWTGTVRCLPERLEIPLHWKKPRRVFVNSMSDLFHEGVPDGFIANVFSIMAVCSNLTFQVLTKRPARMLDLLGSRAFEGMIDDFMDLRAAKYGWCLSALERWPLPNVWLGVSTENQAAADERIPLLLETPAAVRFISAEPLLGGLDLNHIRPQQHGVINALTGDWVSSKGFATGSALNWIIAGGESGGPPARRLIGEQCPSVRGSGWPCGNDGCINADDEGCDLTCACNASGWIPKPEALGWVRSIRDQCTAAGVAFFHKQWGGPTPKSGGRVLDGRTWDEFPKVEVPACP